MKPTQEQLNDPVWWSNNVSDEYDYAFTTGPEWDGDDEHIGTIEFAKEDGSITDDEALAIDRDCWVLLATRPTKPAFVPKVGELVETCFTHDGWSKRFFIGITRNGQYIVESHNGSVSCHSADQIRPIKSERELFIDIIVAHGNLSEGVLADGILNAGFCLKDAD